MTKRRGFLRSLFAAPLVVPAIAAAAVKAAEPEPEMNGGDMVLSTSDTWGTGEGGAITLIPGRRK